MESKGRPLETALLHLRVAIERHRDRNEDDPLLFLALVKAFEVAVEYGWRELRHRLQEAGLDVFAPKDVVRKAARADIIADPELWIKAIDARNASVHDYFGIGDAAFVKQAREFLEAASRLVAREISA